VLKYYCVCVCDARAAPARTYNNAQAKHESGPFIQQPSAVLSHIFGDNTGKQACARVLYVPFWSGAGSILKSFLLLSSGPVVLIKTIFFLLASGVSVLSHLLDLSRYVSLGPEKCIR
jgi:hypothetical protein